MTQIRSDIHRPSVIVPEDYRFVGLRYIGGNPFAIMAFASDREMIAQDFIHTNGRYSGHDHGGTCSVCGANALTLAVYHHAKSNVYICTGMDCAEKMDLGGRYAFSVAKKKLAVANESLKAQEAFAAGKQKALAILKDAGLEKAYQIWESPPNASWAVTTLKDIVGKLVRYGSLSDKQMGFLKSLVSKVENAAVVEAQIKAEAAAAPPVAAGRYVIEGVVVSTKTVDSPFGLQKKMLVKLANGQKLWGTVPSSINGEGLKGSEVKFVATVSPSKDDHSFGFFSRPTNAVVVKDPVAA